MTLKWRINRLDSDFSRLFKKKFPKLITSINYKQINQEDRILRRDLVFLEEI